MYVKFSLRHWYSCTYLRKCEGIVLKIWVCLATTADGSDPSRTVGLVLVGGRAGILRELSAMKSGDILRSTA